MVGNGRVNWPVHCPKGTGNRRPPQMKTSRQTIRSRVSGAVTGQPGGEELRISLKSIYWMCELQYEHWVLSFPTHWMTEAKMSGWLSRSCQGHIRKHLLLSVFAQGSRNKQKRLLRGVIPSLGCPALYWYEMIFTNNPVIFWDINENAVEEELQFKTPKAQAAPGAESPRVRGWGPLFIYLEFSIWNRLKDAKLLLVLNNGNVAMGRFLGKQTHGFSNHFLPSGLGNQWPGTAGRNS